MVDRQGRKIQEMFGSIAHRYDFLNHALSLSIDRYWRYLTRKKVTALLAPDALILDLCTGTGDLAFQFARNFRVVGCDFCHPMLVKAREKNRRLADGRAVRFVEGDSLQLPFPSGRFDAVTVAFGLRNLEDYAGGLAEMWRVLKPRGRVGILEFSQPEVPVFRGLYRFYFQRVLPKVGRLVSGVRGPYDYLPDSVGQFPGPRDLVDLLETVGFEETRYFRLSGGVATLHLGSKRAVSSDLGSGLPEG